MSRWFFAGGSSGQCKVDQIRVHKGPGITGTPKVLVTEQEVTPDDGHAWVFWGATSHLRYTTRSEADRLAVRQPPLGRPTATNAALILIDKSPAWWDLAQDERRNVLEEQSHHIAAGYRYLPAIARRLHHSREVGGEFDFLTWFEFAPADSAQFDALVDSLHASPEWHYVDREVDIRLSQP